MVAQELDLLAIIGPTASGKTALSIEIAKKLNGEIISADSRNVYRGLDIGTAKPSIAEQNGIVHYGFDLISPNERYSASEFKKYAIDKIDDIKKRGKLPIIVGGTGLYVDCVLYDFKMPKSNLELRRLLELKDIHELQLTILEKGLVMPENKNNKLHLVTTIERNGEIPTRNDKLPQGWHLIGLKPNNDTLQSRIVKRANDMFESEVINEAKKVADEFGWDCPGLNGGIYKCLRPYLQGEISLEQCKQRFLKSDKLLAKRQSTWFKRNKEIKWFSDTIGAKKWLDSTFK